MTKFVAYKKNLDVTAKLLASTGHVQLIGKSQEEIKQHLKQRTEQTYIDVCRSESAARALNGETIYICWQGIGCLFIPHQTSSNGHLSEALELVFEADALDYNLVQVMFYTALDRADESSIVDPLFMDTNKRVKIDYTNYRGERGERIITPIRVWFGATEWHIENQWLLDAHDHEKDALRNFAMKDIHSWSAI